ncbi:NADPH Oxidase Activator [Abortiporus biennis]
MSLKAELETWAAALKAYDDEDFEKSLELFSAIGDSSKILTNMGLIYATLGEHEAAVEQFIAATSLDQYLAVAYFQCGVSNFLLTRYDLAYKDFEEALLYLRGNQAINYEQLGLKFKLYSAEVLFNKGLSLIYLGRLQEGMIEMEEARKEKATEEHNVVDDAIADRGDGYTVFSIPVGVLYRPPENKLKNAKAKDYLGKAKLVATSDANEQFTTFTGVTRLKQGVTPSGTFLDTPISPEGLNRSATVSVTSRPTVPDVDRPQPLQRSKTTITVPPDARDRIRAAGGSSPGGAGGPSAAGGPALSRSTSSVSPSNRQMPGAPTRGLSVRRPGAPMPLDERSLPPPPPPPPAGLAPPRRSPSARSPSAVGGPRLTEFYDDYLDSYGDDQQTSPPGARVANWAKNNANPSVQRSRSMAPPSSYAPSSVGGTMRRRTTRRRAPTRAQSVYYEEEEGYGSGGEYDEDLLRIRVKIHHQGDVRGMAIDATMPFEDFMERVATKFGASFQDLGLKFKDEDGAKVTLQDAMDYELAIETARENAKGRPEGRLEVWCSDSRRS